MRNAFFPLVLLSAGCFVDAFAPEGGGGSSSSEGAGATSSAGGNGVGASGGQSSGGASSGGSGGVGASSAGGGGTDPSGGGGSGGEGPCDNHFLRFNQGDSARLPFVRDMDEQNDLAFGGRLRVGDHPRFAAFDKQRAGVFGSFDVSQTKGWRLVVEEDGVGTVRIVAEVYLSSTVRSVSSEPVPIGEWHDVRVSYKNNSNPDLLLYVGDVGDMATPVATLDPGNFDLDTFKHAIHFGASVGNDLAYVGDLDDPYFKKGEEGFAMCAGGGSATIFRFDFETDLDLTDGLIDEDCADSDTVAMVLDPTNPPVLGCE